MICMSAAYMLWSFGVWRPSFLFPPLPLAGEAGRGPLGVTGVSRASPAASARAEAGPHPTSPASGRGACAAASQSCRSRVHLRPACRFIVPFHPVSFHSVPSVRRRPASTTGPCFARIACARAPVGAGAVRAPDCPGAPARASRTQDAPIPSASQGFFFAPAPTRKGRRLRMPPPVLQSSRCFPGVKRKTEIFLIL